MVDFVCGYVNIIEERTDPNEHDCYARECAVAPSWAGNTQGLFSSPGESLQTQEIGGLAAGANCRQTHGHNKGIHRVDAAETVVLICSMPISGTNIQGNRK